MTTETQTTRPGPRPGVVGPVVRAALLATLAVGAVLAVAAGVLVGSSALVGVAVGVVMVALFFGLGAVVLDVVAALAPAASLLIALLTYTLKVVLVGLVFVGLNRSGALESTVDARWLGGTVIACTLTWLAAQIVASVRARQPLYDLPSAPAGPTASEQQEASA